MKAHLLGGPTLTIESDRVGIALGNSERIAVGEALASALEASGFSQVEIFTTNQLSSKLSRPAAEDYFKGSVAFGHSRGCKDMPDAKQAILLNPMEPSSIFESLIRAAIVGEDPVTKEPEAHKTGNLDLALAGVELLRSPRTTFETMRDLSNGYSTTEEYTSRKERGDFLEGIAIVHSLQDAFAFAKWEKMNRVADLGMTSILLNESYHNGILFSPRAHLQALEPFISFPKTLQQV